MDNFETDVTVIDIIPLIPVRSYDVIFLAIITVTIISADMSFSD